ncbi:MULTISPECIES: aldehyde dehydrogenase [unclassified Achromobacter]|uniref:aldehyde dehydrogenase n=1 Tax=unclassified Achromobacter TaxID=2626865 RepID=UPI000B516191|nr:MULTISPECIES: aldehyde dehydrogenase [unclassified Achromobacter]OWT81062.1 aldehyde dehydrogenase [Achromobacter sp. HZ34]OWT82563.1 aldehyde dehydrogenase [Achromobacter sp. HZ28]
MSQTSSQPKSLLIDGRWTPAAQTFASVNPANGATNFEIGAADADQVNAAVDSAWRAVRQKAWRDMLPHQRAALLRRMADGIDANAEVLARLQMIENGKVWSECKAQVTSAAATFRYYAGVCETITAEVTPPRGNYLSMTQYEPYGVIVAITPWNSPLTMEAQKVAPALAAGNAVILKPSEVTSSPALELGRIALEAGLPPGILNVVTGLGSGAGKLLVEHPGVRMVSFTGGTASGRAIARVAADKLMPVALELGGKSPHIVCADADLDAAVEGVIGGIFEGSGQSCVAGSRLYVQRSVQQDFLEKLLARARAIRVDQPDAQGAGMGPIASFAHREKIESMVASALKDGGEILTGGGRPNEDRLAAGAFYLPTVIGGLKPDAYVVREEIFGPVLCALPFDDEDDLIAQANDSVYGLASGIWTADYRRAWRVARQLEAGSVWINTYKQLSISTPFGGFKQSGIGREKGASGLRLYQQSKGIYFAM